MQRRSVDIDEPREANKDNRAAEGPRFELFGEMGDWITPSAVCAGARPPIEDLDLPVGVYSYKLKIDGRWALDAANPRTRSASGHRNNVLSIGGAPEPLLFAPAPPFVHEPERGGLVVVAALRRGAGDALVVRWAEGGEPARRTAMARAGEEDEHLLFRAHLPAAAARVRLGFERPVPAGALEGDFVYERAAAAQPPAWWRDAVVYTVFVDRFRPARDRPGWARHPGTRAAGGHLEGVRRSLDALRDAGASVLYLTPIHAAASCHRYDVVDPLRVDPALGGEEALARLLHAAHARGMRVLLDLSFSHAGRGFPPYDDVIARGPESPFARWFQWIDGDPPALRHYGTRRDAPLFDLGHPEVQALVARAAERWAAAGVDGFRLDSAAEVPIGLARRIRGTLRRIRPEAVVVGELVPAHAWRWRAAEALDAATDFGFREVAIEWIARGAIDAVAARRRLEALELGRGAPAHCALRFLSTHDHPRFATLARIAAGPAGAARARLGLVLLFTWAGVPALLYGEEVGLSSAAPELEIENVWPDRAPMPWPPEGRDEATHALVRALAAARRASPALSGGDLEIVHAEGDLLVYRRAAEGEVVDVALNAGRAPLTVALEDDALPGLAPLCAAGEVTVAGQRVTLGACAALVARRFA